MAEGSKIGVNGRRIWAVPMSGESEEYKVDQGDENYEVVSIDYII